MSLLLKERRICFIPNWRGAQWGDWQMEKDPNRSVLAQAVMTKYSRLGDLPGVDLTITVLEAEKSSSKVPAGIWLLVEAFFLACRWFSCVVEKVLS